MDIKTLENYNLNDAIKFNPTLNKRLWDDREHLKSDVKKHLLQIADEFCGFLGIDDFNLKDITISGSNASYTYTPNSDIDLHLIIDMPDNPVYKELFDARKSQFNSEHNIKIGGYPVELYVQDSKEPHVSQGIYSILNDKWLSVPKRKKADINDSSVRHKYDCMQNKIEDAIASGDFESMKKVMKRIKSLRKAGLDKSGEFSPENLAFKMLRSQGVIQKLIDARNEAKDRELSLAERNKAKKKYTYGFNEDATLTPDGVNPTTCMFLNEEDKDPETIATDFIHYCVDKLGIETMPRIRFKKDPQWSVRNKTFGRYSDEDHTLIVGLANRHIMDILRTIAHELTHKRQHETQNMPHNAGETGSKWENEANAKAGILMRNYAKMHPEYFDDKPLSEASGYIPTKAQANDPRFKMALTQDVRPGTLGKCANAFMLNTDSQGHPQIANPSGKVDRLVESLQKQLRAFKEDATLTPDGVNPTTCMFLNETDDDMPKMGINVRSDKKSGLDYADMIVDGVKSLETRRSDSLRPYVGKRVGIVRTGNGPAKAIGAVTVGEPIVADVGEFRKLTDKHKVPEGSAFDIQPESVKYLYPMLDPIRFNHEYGVGHGILSRKVNRD